MQYQCILKIENNVFHVWFDVNKFLLLPAVNKYNTVSHFIAKQIANHGKLK